MAWGLPPEYVRGRRPLNAPVGAEERREMIAWFRWRTERTNLLRQRQQQEAEMARQQARGRALGPGPRG